MGGSVIGDWITFRGMRFPKGLIPAFLAFDLIVSVLQLFDSFGLWSFPMIHRAIIAVRFDLGFNLFSVIIPLLAVLLLSLFKGERYFELLLSLLLSLGMNFFFGLEVSVACFSILVILLNLFSFVDVVGFLFWLFVFLAGIEAASLSHWLFFLPLGLKTPFEFIANLEMYLSFMVVSISPYLVLALFFACFLKPLIRLFEGRIMVLADIEKEDSSVFSSRMPYFLLIIIFFSVLAALYPFSPNINPTGEDVGVDFQGYVEKAELVEKDPAQALKIYYGQRPVIYLAIFAVQKLFNLDVPTVIRYFPVFLNPLMVLTVYFISKEFFNDAGTAVWASFFTVFGFPITVGMYSYFLTNMLGLCLAYASLGFLFRAIKNRDVVNFVVAFLFAVLLAFTHPWTFVQYFAPLMLVIFVLPQMSESNMLDLKISRNTLSRARYFLLFFIVVLIVVELLRINVFHGYGGFDALKLAFRRLTTIEQFWHHFNYPLKSRFGGLLSNVILLGLALIFILFLNLRNVSEFYLWIIMVATSALYLIGSEIIKSRLFYNIPIGLLAALGYVTILKNTSSDELKLSFSFFIVFSMVVYLFRSLANIV